MGVVTWMWSPKCRGAMGLSQRHKVSAKLGWKAGLLTPVQASFHCTLLYFVSRSLPPQVHCRHPEPADKFSLSWHGPPPRYSRESWVLIWTLPLFRPGPVPGSLGCPGCARGTLSWLTRLGVETCQSSLWEQRWLLSPRSQLLISWWGRWGGGCSELVRGGKAGRGLGCERCPLVGSQRTDTGRQTASLLSQTSSGEANQSPQGTQGLGGCLALRHWGRESSRSPSPGTC